MSNLRRYGKGDQLHHKGDRSAEIQRTGRAGHGMSVKGTVDYLMIALYVSVAVSKQTNKVSNIA